MIELTCAKCRNVLSVDNAFAGGVCRCNRCGAIQTVPSRARSRTPVGPGSSSSPGDSFMPGLDSSTSAALDELADIISSSTLTGTGLASNRILPLVPPVDVSPAPRIGHAVVVISGAAGLLIILLLGVIIYLLIQRTPPVIMAVGQPGQPGLPVTSPSEQPGAEGVRLQLQSSPAFCDIELTGRTVIYVLDRGSGTQVAFGYLKDATLSSIRSLGSRRKFQIIFWDNGSVAAFPQDVPIPATVGAVNAAREQVADVFAFGQSNARAALEAAFANGPDEIVLATGKSWDLDQAFVEMVVQLHHQSPHTKIHTFAIGGSSDSRALARVARHTGGTYVELSAAELRAFGH